MSSQSCLLLEQKLLWDRDKEQSAETRDHRVSLEDSSLPSLQRAISEV